MMRPLVFIIASLAASVLATPLVVNTPVDVVQCAATEITWSGGVAPYSLVIRDNGQIVEDSARLSDTTFEWGGFGAPAGSSVVFTVSDNKGAQAQSAPVTVQPSSDSSCLDPGA